VYGGACLSVQANMALSKKLPLTKLPLTTKKCILVKCGRRNVLRGLHHFESSDITKINDFGTPRCSFGGSAPSSSTPETPASQGVAGAGASSDMPDMEVSTPLRRRETTVTHNGLYGALRFWPNAKAPHPKPYDPIARIAQRKSRTKTRWAANQATKL